MAASFLSKRIRHGRTTIVSITVPEKTLCTLLYFRCGTESLFPNLCREKKDVRTVSENRYHTRQAAAALLKMAKTTSDPGVAARLVEAAADLKEQAGELPVAASPHAPDVKAG